MAISSRPVICQGCRKTFVREEGNFEKDSKGYYHKECYVQKQKNKDDSSELFDFIEQIWGNNSINYPLINKQIKELTQKNNMTVQGITGTLNYLHNIKKVKLNLNAGIIIVAYHYEAARKYYAQKANIQSHSKEDFVQERVEVSIAPQETNKYKKLIDIEEMFRED